MANTFSARFQSAFALLIGVALFASIVVLTAPHIVSAAWNQPTCDPDSSGPTDPACNVSAPLNVSSATQTKSGGLIIQNTVQANKLELPAGITGATGALIELQQNAAGQSALAINATNGKAININHSSTTERVIQITSNTSANVLEIAQSGSGVGIQLSSATTSPSGALDISQTGSGVAIRASASGGGSTIGVDNTNAGAYAISATHSAAGIAIYASVNSPVLPAIYGTNSNATTGSSGVKGCATGGTNCTLLGTPNYAAYMQSNTSIGTSTASVPTGDALAVFANGTTDSGIYVETTGGKTGFELSTGGGSAIGAQLTLSGTSATALDINSNGTASPTGINISASSASSPTGIVMSLAGSNAVGVNITNTSGGTGVQISGAATGVNASATSVAIQGDSSTGQAGIFKSGSTTNTVEISNSGGGTPSALYAHASVGYGIYGNAEGTLYGGLFCNLTANCSYLGGPTYAASFNGDVTAAGRVTISDSVNNNYIVSIQNTDTNATNTGRGIQVHTESGSLTPSTTATNATAIDAQSKSGYGLFAYSEDSVGLVSTGGQGGIIGTTGTVDTAGVYGSNTSTTTGEGGYFEAYGVSSTALVADNLGGGLGADILATSGGDGVHIDAHGGGIGETIQVDPYAFALETFTGTINNQGAYQGGQFYSHEHAANGVYKDDQWLVHRFTGLSSHSDIMFDGSDIWVTNKSVDQIKRLNNVDGRAVFTWGMAASLDPQAMQLIDDDVYVFGYEAYEVMPLYDVYAAAGPYSALPGGAPAGSMGDIISVAHDGNSIWLGTNQGDLYDFDYSTGTVTTGPVYGAAIQELVFADGFIWATVNTVTGTVKKIDPTTRTEFASITVGGYPRGMEYDGQFIWVANSTTSNVTRIHPDTYAVQTIDVKPLGNTPLRLTFDGTNIWVVFIDDTGGGTAEMKIGAIRGATLQLSQSSIVLQSNLEGGVLGSTEARVIFDGTYVLVVNTQKPSIYRVASGGGFGHGATPVTKGIFMYSTSGDLYCIYMNGATLTPSTTLSDCR